MKEALLIDTGHVDGYTVCESFLTTLIFWGVWFVSAATSVVCLSDESINQLILLLINELVLERGSKVNHLLFRCFIKPKLHMLFIHSFIFSDLNELTDHSNGC